MSPRSGDVMAAPDAPQEPRAAAGPLLSIGAAAARAGVTERSLRYYQELGLLVPSGRTKGGMRRYSEADLERVARIRELQTVVGLNLDEVADVLRNEARLAELRVAYRNAAHAAGERRKMVEECLVLATELRQVVEAKRHAIEVFTADLDARIDRIKAAIAEAESLETIDAG